MKNLLTRAKISPDQGAVMKKPRRNHIAVFRAKVALPVFKDDKTLPELAEKFDVHANPISQGKVQSPEVATGVFLTPGENRERARPSLGRYGATTPEGLTELRAVRIIVGRRHFQFEMYQLLWHSSCFFSKCRDISSRGCDNYRSHTWRCI